MNWGVRVRQTLSELLAGPVARGYSIPVAVIAKRTRMRESPISTPAATPICLCLYKVPVLRDVPRK